MILDKAKELLLVQADFGGLYNGNSAKLVLSEVGRVDGQQDVDFLIRETRLDQVFDFVMGTRFDRELADSDKNNPDGKQ